jgi:hypothetical protein
VSAAAAPTGSVMIRTRRRAGRAMPATTASCQELITR